jgi:thioester reductase-like protein
MPNRNNVQPKTSFVTGANGFLVDFLLEQGNQVIALVRGSNPTEKLAKALREVSDKKSLEPRGREKLEVIKGDIRVPGFGLEEKTLSRLVTRVDEVWHCAATFKFREQDQEEIIACNITGTRNLLDFALACNKWKAPAVFYVSTAYAAPVRDGQAREELSFEGTAYRNLYEWSKQKAECLVAEYRQTNHLPAYIFRPSVIIGHSQTCNAVGFNGYYNVIKSLYFLKQSLFTEALLGLFHTRLKANPDLLANLVPVDFVVRAMWEVVQAKPEATFIFHLVNDFPVPLAHLFEVASKTLGLPKIELASQSALQQKPLTHWERFLSRKFLETLRFQAPYLHESPLFDATNFRRVVPRALLPSPKVDQGFLDQVNQRYLRFLDEQSSRGSSSIKEIS